MGWRTCSALGVRIARKQDGKERQLALLVKNDYFGEMALVANRRRSATVTAMADTSLLVLSRKNFEKLFKTAPQIRLNLDVVIRSRQLARRLRFKWLGADEVVYFLARKHPVILYQKLVLPVLLSIAVFVAVLLTLTRGESGDNAIGPQLFDAVDKLMKGELKTTDQTWEAIISKEGSTPEAWKKALDVMGHMAMLRNVRNHELLDDDASDRLRLSKLDVVRLADIDSAVPLKWEGGDALRALGKRLGHQPEFVMLQVTQSTVDQLAAGRRGVRRSGV